MYFFTALYASLGRMQILVQLIGVDDQEDDEELH
jgi:hypothetical protein